VRVEGGDGWDGRWGWVMEGGGQKGVEREGGREGGKGLCTQ
jgi:hypothetical protein